MRQEEFTPGPWQWWTSNSWKRLTAHNKRGGDYEREGNVLCPFTSRSDGHPDCDVSNADMHLISAAPELYEALKAQEAWEADVILNADWSSGRAHLTQAQCDALTEVQKKRNAALAKARGEAKAVRGAS